MTKSRMAGSKLDEPTKESADAKEALSRSEDNKRIRERIGNDPDQLAERISVVDRDKYDFTGYTDKEINMAFRGGEFGDKDYARLTGKDDGGGNGDGDKDKDPKDPMPEVPNPPENAPPRPMPPAPPGVGPRPPVAPKPPGVFGGGQQQIVSQDNDITNTINGDNNTITNNQDNSIRQSMGSSDYASRYARGLKDKYVLNLLDR